MHQNKSLAREEMVESSWGGLGIRGGRPKTIQTEVYLKRILTSSVLNGRVGGSMGRCWGTSISKTGRKNRRSVGWDRWGGTEKNTYGVWMPTPRCIEHLVSGGDKRKGKIILTRGGGTDGL